MEACGGSDGLRGQLVQPGKRGLFEVVHDTLAPRTGLTIGVPVFHVDQSTYITGQTPLTLGSDR